MVDESITGDSRKLPRVDCSLRDVVVARDEVTPISVGDISTEGIQLSYHGKLSRADRITLTLRLPGDRRKLTLNGEVIYTTKGNAGAPNVAGIRLVETKEVARARIRNFILQTSGGRALRKTFRQMADEGNEFSFTIEESEAVRTLLQEMCASGQTLHILVDASLQVIGGVIEEVDGAGASFRFRPESDLELEELGEAKIYGTFWLGSGTHYFESRVRSAFRDGEIPSFAVSIPEKLYQSDKRSYPRHLLEYDRVLELEFGGSYSEAEYLAGRLIEVSRRGFRCEVELPSEMRTPSPGEIVGFTPVTEIGEESIGQVRHVTDVSEGNPGRLFHIGVEKGIDRREFRSSRIVDDEWEQSKAASSFVESKFVPVQSTEVRYSHPDGREIVAVLTGTRFGTTAPVVIIPPAFGKRKETLAPFVTTLVSNFARAGKDIVTLRFDGVNRPGESHNDLEDPPWGYEMLKYRPRQGVEDLRTTVDYVRNNPHVKPECIIFFSSSMSSVDVRKLLASGAVEDASGWVSLMGVSSAQSSLMSILAGTDLISNWRQGISNGVRGLLGHVVDTDSLAGDLVEDEYAYQTDARRDMARISTDVIWILGSYDRWVDRRDVADLMSVKALGDRELIEVPTGHNLRSSDDALEVFRMITEALYTMLHGGKLQASIPRQEDTVKLVTFERERLERREDLSATEYWNEYLLGNDRNPEGYDFFKNFPEFAAFLQFQAELANPEPGCRIADMGCGTGLMSEALLEQARLTASGQSRNGPIELELVAVDLVEGALERTSERVRRMKSAHPVLANTQVELLVRDLEPNRFSVIRDFLTQQRGDIRFLAGRLPGLSNAVIDEVLAAGEEGVKSVITAEIDETDLSPGLAAELSPEARRVIGDLNRVAARVREEMKGNTQQCPPKLDVLDFANAEHVEGYDLPDEHYDTVVASLFISYLLNADYSVREFFRMLKPGGRVVVSSMKPDSDVSVIFTDYVEQVRRSREHGGDQALLNAAEEVLNEAAALFELEEEGLFRFYSAEELREMLNSAGFVNVRIHRGMGSPPQAVIAIGEKPYHGSN